MAALIADPRPDPAFRRPARRGRGRFHPERRRDPRPDRPERCRQDHLRQPSVGPPPAAIGHDHAWRARTSPAFPPMRGCRKGIAYTFQITSIFPRLSVFDNVALAAQLHGPADLATRTRAALARVGLEGLEAQEAQTLSYGHQRLLELAMGLALRPRVLILDEPTQGLAASEIDGFKRAGRKPCPRDDRPADRAQHGGGDGPCLPDHRPELRPGPGHRHAGRDPCQPRRAGGLSWRLRQV